MRFREGLKVYKRKCFEAPSSRNEKRLGIRQEILKKQFEAIYKQINKGFFIEISEKNPNKFLEGLPKEIKKISIMK